MSATSHKFVIVGAGAVGKSALVVRFIKVISTVNRYVYIYRETL